FRRPDDSPVDRDMAMAEDARDEYGKRYKRAVALKVAADEIGNRHFGGFEFLCAAHAVEDFAWIVDSKKIEIDSVRFHIARVEREHAVIEPAREGHRYVGHGPFAFALPLS